MQDSNPQHSVWRPAIVVDRLNSLVNLAVIYPFTIVTVFIYFAGNISITEIISYMATRQYTQLIIVYAFPTIFAVGLFIFTGYNETTI